MARRWTTADFETLSWHDVHVHAFRLQPDEAAHTCDIQFDIDFILDWLPQPDNTIHFRIAPAVLTFHNVINLCLRLDYTSFGVTPFSLDGLYRMPTAHAAEDYTSRWHLPVNFPAGDITFDSPGFTQVQMGDAVIRPRQWLTGSERRA